MPTGYTAALHDGEQSFEDYAMGVARAFGALITMRDDDPDAQIPEVFEPSEYYVKSVTETRAERDRLYAMTLDEAHQAQKEEIAKQRAYADKYVAERDARRARYEAMLEKAHAYEPPTPDHKGFKEMMVTQLEESIRFYCGDYDDYTPSVPERREPTAWLSKKIAEAERAVDRAEVALEEEVQRAKGRTAWVQALRSSLASRDSQETT